MRVLLIYNPVSGKTGNKEEVIGNIIWKLNSMDTEVMSYQTKDKGDAVQYLLQANLKDYDMLVCCGGDGTLHEIVNAVMKLGIKIVIGYIPLGSTNDYAKNLDINEKNALLSIKNGKVGNIDIGNFNGEYFNYVAAFGAFTNVSFTASQQVKNSLGYLAYLLEGVKHISEIRSYHVKCKADKYMIEDDILIGMITNAISVAGVKSKSHETKLDDGLLEYIFIKMPKNILDLQSIVMALLNSKVDERYMYYGKAKKFQIESEPMAWTLDGENGGVREFVEIDTYCRALSIIVGENFCKNEM